MKEIGIDNMGMSALQSYMLTVKQPQLAKKCTEAINNLLIPSFLQT